MRIIIITLCILTIACSSKQTSSYEQLVVIATVYESIPNVIPPPNNEVEDENGNQDKIFTDAWSKLTNAEQNSILKIITDEKQNGEKECQ